MDELETFEAETQAPDLVNRLTRELAEMHRTIATIQRKLTNTTRSLEMRTQELMESRAALALLQATLDVSQEGTIAMGYFGRAMHFNARFLEIWGIPAHKASVLNDAALLAIQLTQVKDPARFLDFAQARRARPDEARHEIFELTDGRVLDCRVMPQKMRNRRVGSVTSCRDITEYDRLERLVTILESEMPAIVAEAKATML